MGMRSVDRKTVARISVLFLYGALAHLILLKGYAQRAYPPGSDDRFISHPLTYIGVAVAGGVSVTWFMLRLLRKVAGLQRDRPVWTLAKAGLYGVYATILTIAVFSVLASVFLSQRMASSSWQAPLLFMFNLMGIGTYGMGAALATAPFAFAYGFFAGACILWVRRHAKSWAELPQQPEDRAKLSLTLGILGLLLFFVPFVGLVLSILAVVQGAKTLKGVRDGVAAQKKLATAGIVLGIVCVTFQIFSFAVFEAVRLGWIKPVSP